MAQAVQKGTTGLLKTLAGVYGVPVSDTGTVDATTAKSSMAGLEAETERLRSQSAVMRQENEGLRRTLDAAKQGLPAGTTDADTNLRAAALDRLVKDLEDYRRRVDALGVEKKAGTP